MKKWFFALVMLLACVIAAPLMARAAVQSSDTMILDWRTEKVWIDGGDLCVKGTFTNKRDDLTITKLNDMVMEITFTRDDGSKYQYAGKPKKMPMLKIKAKGSKSVTLNFGPYSENWKDWVTTESYVFTYINGARW